MHVMLDLETLGTRGNSAIIEIGAVLFEAKNRGKILNNKTFQAFVIPHEEAHFDFSTVLWWMGQSAEARERFVKAYPDNVVTESFALDSFRKWFAIEGLGGWDTIEGVWSHGASFDQPIIEEAFRRNNMRAPWEYGKSRDTRTLFALAGGYPPVDKSGFLQHSAVDDAIYQAMAVQKAFGILGI